MHLDVCAALLKGIAIQIPQLSKGLSSVLNSRSRRKDWLQTDDLPPDCGATIDTLSCAVHRLYSERSTRVHKLHKPT